MYAECLFFLPLPSSASRSDTVNRVHSASSFLEGDSRVPISYLGQVRANLLKTDRAAASVAAARRGAAAFHTLAALRVTL